MTMMSLTQQVDTSEGPENPLTDRVMHVEEQETKSKT